MTGIEQELRRFIIDNFLLGHADPGLTAETSFLEQGLIDSTGALELVSFLEHRYAIKVEDDELVPDNLDSIANLVRVLERELQADGA